MKMPLGEYLISVFGAENVTGMPVPEGAIPYVFTKYRFESFIIKGRQYIFLYWDDQTTMREYTYRIPIFEKRSGLPLVLVLENTFEAQIKNLMDLGLRFVEPGRQVWIPEAGVVLRKTRKSMPAEPAKGTAKAEQGDRFNPQAQLCALYFLYSPAGKHTSGDIQARTGLSGMAVSRALRTLAATGALSAVREGSVKVYELQDKPAFYRCIQRRLRSPVCKEVMVKRADLTPDCYEAGYTAMSEWTMLADDYESTYAVSGRRFREMNAECGPATGKLLYSRDYAILQVWTYDPALFADTPGCADKVSVWLSMMMDNPDERTEGAVHRLMDGILGWHPEDDGDC